MTNAACDSGLDSFLPNVEDSIRGLRLPLAYLLVRVNVIGGRSIHSGYW
jgi:hypothetical protein